ncbi:hypothetical protein BCLUESOX_837 [bacterium endosymbiont of Bathymodiolus sp. 5 South]|nr:hypothetical protein BCLUESOX_837 [bacterium endosymbiont of Bathymodiolus sp. 5 South]VVH57690.1 hypothetical protein BSPCLSOX_1813 [uncultured Gammaproteobacteria bacterium]
MNGVHFFGFDCGFGVWMVLFLDLGSIKTSGCVPRKYKIKSRKSGSFLI